jgi:hypothetical protein
MNKLTAEQLRQFLNEIEADGHDLSGIEVNFRDNEDSDITPIGFVFEDLYDEDNTSLTSIVFQGHKLYQAHTTFIGFENHASEYVGELNNLIGRKAFSHVNGDNDMEPNLWVILGTDITSEEVDRLDLMTDFILL